MADSGPRRVALRQRDADALWIACSSRTVALFVESVGHGARRLGRSSARARAAQRVPSGWARTIIVYDLRVQEMLKEDLNVLSNNGLDLKVDASVRYRVDAQALRAAHADGAPGTRRSSSGPSSAPRPARCSAATRREEMSPPSKRAAIEKEIYDEVPRALQGKHVVVRGHRCVRDVVLPEAIRQAIADKLAEDAARPEDALHAGQGAPGGRRKLIEAEGIAKYQSIVRQGLTEESCGSRASR